MKPFASISAFLLGLIAVGHLLRVLAGWPLVINETVIPMWPSVLVFLVFGWLAIMLWREAKRGIVEDLLRVVEKIQAK